MVDEGFGEIARVAERRHRVRALAFRHPPAIRTADHRQVGIDRRLPAKRVEQVELAGGVVDVIVAANDVADLEVQIIDHHREVVGGGAVRPGDDQVVELGVVEAQTSLDRVLDDHLPLDRIPEANDRSGGVRGRGAQPPAAAVVTRLLATRTLRFAQRLQAFPSAIAGVGSAALEQLPDPLAIAPEAPGLKRRAFVPVEPQPDETLQDALHRDLGGTRPVGVLDAQQEAPAVTAGVEPAEQGGTRAADVQVTGRARCEAGAYRHPLPRLEDRAAGSVGRLPVVVGDAGFEPATPAV